MIKLSSFKKLSDVLCVVKDLEETVKQEQAKKDFSAIIATILLSAVKILKEIILIS